jgi:Protein of unknown function with PCYCGC motif
MSWLTIRWRAALAAAAALIVVVTACGSEPPAGSASADPPKPAAQSSAPAVSGYAGALPPLPVVQFALARPEPMLRAAYEFAARHPDVLRYMPCFCGCERNGHGNNEDCFIEGRDGNGKPRWSPHGLGCGICIDVALQAKQLHGSGAALADIRAAIDAKHRSEHPTSTATPLPPK